MRQGDPLSSYLFVETVEIQTIAVRQNTAISGITIGKDETKLFQYADDTTAVLSDIIPLASFLSCSMILRSCQVN